MVDNKKTLYYYSGEKLVYESRPDGIELYFLYDSYGNLTSIRYIKGTTDKSYYVATNIQGDVLGIYSGSGDLIASYDYDAWGKCTVINHVTGNSIGELNPIRYRGYYYDTETGLYYLQSRYYDPQVGKFLNSDSLIDNRNPTNLNVFAYCANNPVKNEDPTGHILIGALTGGIIGAATGAIVAFVKGKSIVSGALTGAVTGAAVGVICEVIATGGLSGVVGGVLAGVISAVGEAANQYCNYRIEKNNYMKNNKNNATTATGKHISDCKNFGEYADVGSIVSSGIIGGFFAPISAGASNFVDEAFSAVGTELDDIAKFATDFLIGVSLDMLQMTFDLF